jgi:sugar-specific transcriptional regulator TrmB
MSLRMDEITRLLEHFGLDTNEVTIYLTLLQNGSLGATEIGRLARVPKTSVYRCLEQLKVKKLVTEVVEEYRRLFEAAPVENLKYQIIEQQQKVKVLSESLPQIIASLSKAVQQDVDKTSKIKYYSGIEGLKQVTWNSSKAKEMLRIFEIKDMSAFLNFDFCEITRREFVRNQVFTRELTNEAEVSGWTDVSQMVREFWELRYVDPTELKMEFEMLVYNNVYVMYNYQDGEVFCAEIYNERLARMQKQIFDFIWLKSRKFRILDEHGAAKLL